MAVFQRLKSDKLLSIKTFLLCVIYSIIGYGVAMFGPVLLDLQIQVNGTLKETATVIPARAIGHAIGSFAGGLVPDKWPIEMIITVCTALTAFCFAIAPWCPTVYSLLAAVALSGFFLGPMEVLSNVYTFNLWDKDTAIVIQVMYLFFGVGAMVAPLIAGPFLLMTEEDATHNHTGKSVTKVPTSEDLQLEYPFLIFAIVTLLTALCFGMINFKGRGRSEKITEDEEEKSMKELSPLAKFSVVSLATLVLHVYFGVEMAFGTMLETFLVTGPPGWDKQSAAYATSLFWGTYTFLRLITTVFLSYIGPVKFLIIYFALIISANVVLLSGICGKTGLWIGAVLMGTGLSSIFGLILAYLGEKMKLTSRIMSAFLVAACMGEFVYPLLTATYIHIYPNIFLYINAFGTGLVCILFALMHILCTILYK